jgi:hypothetical protein
LRSLFNLDDFCFHHAALRAPKHPLFVGGIAGGSNLSDLHCEATALARGKYGVPAYLANDLVKHIWQIFRTTFPIGFVERLGLSFVLHLIRPLDRFQQYTALARLCSTICKATLMFSVSSPAAHA